MKNIQKTILLAAATALMLCTGCSQSQTDSGIPDPSAVPDSSLTVTTETGINSQTTESPLPDSQISDNHTPDAKNTNKESLLSPSSQIEDSTKTTALADFGDLKGQEIESLELEKRLQSMTLEEKVAQLFIILPESLIEDPGPVTAAGELTRNAFNQIPVGGFIYLGGNLQSAEQVKTMLSNVQTFSMDRLGLPAFLSVDEEGGRVARIGGSGRFDVPVIGSMSEIGKSQDKNEAYNAGLQIGSYLSQLGFNLDFAPVADVLSNPDNQVVESRSLGSDPESVSSLALAVAEGLHDQGILSVYKHFPGHGATAGDTHDGYAYTDKTIEELREGELIPFRDGIRAGIPFIMVGHFSLPQVTGDQLPASLSPAVITGLLRKEMGFDGIVITDALNMGAIAQQYSSADAAIQALKAGNDIILMPADFKEAYQGVLDAVARGELTTERIDESLQRILRVKLNHIRELSSR